MIDNKDQSADTYIEWLKYGLDFYNKYYWSHQDQVWGFTTGLCLATLLLMLAYGLGHIFGTVLWNGLKVTFGL